MGIPPLPLDAAGPTRGRAAGEARRRSREGGAEEVVAEAQRGPLGHFVAAGEGALTPKDQR